MLSGGERGRLALACLALTNANLLLLDEPSNHLDLPSQEVLQSVLADFQGTILLVSHDRYLIDALATQIWEVEPENSALRVFLGSYSQYRAAQLVEAEAAKAAKAAAESSARPVETRATAQPGADGARSAQPARSNNRERQRKQRLSALETEIHEIETRLSVIGSQLEAPPSDPGLVHRLGQEYVSLQATLDQRMEEWAELSEA